MKLTIENFKAFKNSTSIDIETLTLLSGLNSAGKSTIYQSLLLLGQSANSYLKDEYGSILPYLKLNGKMIYFGSNNDILADKKKNYVKFAMSSGRAMLSYKFSISKTREKIGYSKENPQKFYLSEIEVVIPHKTGDVGYTLVSNGYRWQLTANGYLTFASQELRDYLYGLAKLHANDQNQCVDQSDSINQTPFPFKIIVELSDISKVRFFNFHLVEAEIPLIGIQDLVKDNLREKIDFDHLTKNAAELGIKNGTFTLNGNPHMFDEEKSLTQKHVVFIPPYKWQPKRIYTNDDPDNPLANFNTKSKRSVIYDYCLKTNKTLSGTLEKGLVHWISERFKIAKNVSVEEKIKGVTSEIFITTLDNIKLPYANIGYGTTQLIPIIHRILSSTTNSIIVVDEPETHLHPCMQSLLADFFVAMALTGRVIILETHSEYIIDKLIYCAIKFPHLRDKLQMYWVLREGGSSTIRHIEYDDLGYIINAPQAFLSEKTKLVEELNQIRVEKLLNA